MKEPKTLDTREIPIFGTRVPGCIYVHRPSAYALVTNQRDEIAVARTPVACYLPGGGMEAGETPEQAIVREGREECGFILQPVAVVGRALEICYSLEEQAYFEKDSYFIAAKVIGHTEQTEPDHELIWLSPQQAMTTLSHGSHRWAVELSRRTLIHHYPDSLIC